MDKLKRIIWVLLSFCMIISFASCDSNDNPDPDAPSTTQTVDDETSGEATPLSLNKEYISHYEWYEDSSEMLVRSEYTDVTLDKSMEKKYPILAKTLSETSAMRKRSMEEEKDNFLASATEEFENDSESFSTYVSSLDVKVRRADNIAVSILEDYGKEHSRAFSGYNYDTESGRELTLSDVVTDVSKIPAAVEKEIMNSIGQDEPDGKTAVIDYFNNTSEEDITWTLDYNGITFWFNAGDIAPTNFGIQVVTVTFAEYPDLFHKKYTVVPDAYIVSLPVSVPFFTDITGDKKDEELTVSGDYDEGERFYHTISVCSETAEYETGRFSFVDPYYVRTSDGNSYLYVFSMNKEEEAPDSTLSVYTLKDSKVKLLGSSKIGLLCRDSNIFALPTDPNRLQLSTYSGETASVFSADENGIPMKTVNVSSDSEFLNAISPNTEIVIKEGYYNLSDYVEKQSQNFTHKFVRFDECFDGAEIFIKDVSFIKISGNTKKFSDTELVVTPRYATVLNFENCNSIEISNLTIGHVDAGECSGDVLDFSNCSDVTIDNTDIFGCGVYGIRAKDKTGNVYVSNSTIRDCSDGPMDISDVCGVFEFTNCTLTGSDGFGYFERGENGSLAFRNCTFGYWETSHFMFLEDIITENCTWSEDYVYPEYGY